MRRSRLTFRRGLLGLWLAALLAFAQGEALAQSEMARWRTQAARVTIVRDDWGIAHVRGKSDADAVFGMIYAQAEDDFNRVETNFINAMGRLAEAEGEAAIWRDLRMKLFIQPEDLKARYAASPDWLKRLMIAWADGLNFYLATHPHVAPRVIRRFEPWMALSFSEGSIGGDIEKVSVEALEEFYGKQTSPPAFAGGAGGGSLQRTKEEPPLTPPRTRGGELEMEPGGSNGFAIAPANCATGNALLLINPHTSFFFRSEQQVTSDEGLNAYGAATWGQFFIYQGFNDRAGWMHTTSGLDVVDEYLETIVERDGRHFYRHGGRLRPVEVRTIAIPYRTPIGLRTRTFTTYRTHHGPIVRAADGKWVSIALMHRPVDALSQSFLRTKARDHASFMKVMELKANSSNNTIFADANGTIAYLHPQFIPRRNDRFDFTRPVDGSNPAADWGPLHALAEAPHVRNPANGWIQNTNNWPYSAAGEHSPRRERFARYMDSFGENPRGIHAMLVLKSRKDFTLERLRAAAYDSYQPAFAQIIPPLLDAWDAAPEGPLKRELAGPIAALRPWDYRWSTGSVATSIAVFWADEMWRRLGFRGPQTGLVPYERIAAAPPNVKLAALAAATQRLTTDFGTWRTPWGAINRFQRVSAAIYHPFSDAAPSIPVGFTAGRWGSLASFAAQPYKGSKRWYGTAGNSFVAVVEFGRRVRAKAVTAGGLSGHPASRHFNDQAARYAAGDLRDVYFHPDELRGHIARSYRPGARAQ